MQAYLVIRTKSGENQQKRLKTLLQGPVFRLHHGTDSFRQVSHLPTFTVTQALHALHNSIRIACKQLWHMIVTSA